MECVELNKVGNFDAWPANFLAEVKQGEISDQIGQSLLFENESIRVWKVALHKNERLPFRKINPDHNHIYITLSDCLAITRCSNGKIILLRLKKGDTGILDFKNHEHAYDFENIGEDTLSLNIVEFKESVKTPTIPLNKPL